MSVIKCLMQKAEAGLVSKKTAQQITDHINELQGRMSAGADVTKELEAAQQAFDTIQNRLVQKTKQVAIHTDLVEKGIKRFESGAPVKAVLKSFSFTDEANGYRYGFLGQTAQERVEHNKRIFTGMAVDILDQLNPTKVGLLRDPAKQAEIRKDLFSLLRGGERSKDVAVRNMSEQIADLTTKGGQAFERAGGNISLRNDYMLGRSPVAEKILKVKEDEYVRDSILAYDLDKVRQATDGAISTQEQLTQAIRKDYASIVSGGIIDLADFAPSGIKSIVNSRNHHRIFHFKDADAMEAWQQKYGDSSLYQNVVNYAERIGKDIGILETYGPKPEAFIRTMLRTAAEKDPQGAASAKDVVYRSFRQVTGQWDRNLDPTMDKYLSSYRQMNIANKLGSTVVDAAVMDAVGLNAVAKRMRGLPVLKSIYDNFKSLLTPGLDIDKKEWARLGWLNESFLNDAMYHLKASEAEGGHKLSAQLAQGVMKYTGLTRITNTTKGVNVKHLGETLANTAYEDMPDAFKRWMSANGVDKELLDKVKQFGTEEIPEWKGVSVISPSKLYEQGYTEEAATIGALFNRIQEIVSPTTSPELRAWFSNFERGGKAAQLLAGSSKTFTGYVGSFYNNHLRVLAAQPGYGNKIKWAAATANAMLMSGVISTWLRDLANGKDPAFNNDTVMRALARTNILPMIGDFVLSQGHSFGGSVLDSVGGVFLSDVNTAAKAAGSLVHGDVKNLGSQTQRLLENLIPGKNAWFAGLALKRTMLDQLRYLYDPNAEKTFKTRSRQASKDGTPFWWAPGHLTPDRAPNLGNIAEQPYLPTKKGPKK